VGLAAGGGQDMLDLDSARDQCIGDQRPVASPGHGFRAHDRRRTAGCKFQELGQIFSERRSLHVIRVAAKAGVFPAGVDGILAGVP